MSFKGASMEELQRSILTAAIFYEDFRYLIFGELQEEHFTNEYKAIFKEMYKLYRRKQDIDAVIILSNLGNAYAGTIAELSDIGYKKPDIEQYIKKIKDDYSSNIAIRQTEELLFDLREKRIEPEEAQNKYIEISKHFNSDDKKFKSYTMAEATAEAYKSYFEKENYFKTGFKKIDDTVKISKGDYIIIGGRPQSGKTTFASNIMYNMARKNKVIFFSLETNMVNIINKLACSVGKIQLDKIMNKSFTEDEESHFANILSELMKSNLEILEAAGMNTNKIFTKTLQRQADIIFIDYLSIINADSKTMYEKVTRLSNELHEFSQREKVTTIALSQLRRPEPGRKIKEPTMNDLRESGAIEQDADAIFLLHDPADNLTEEEQAEKRKSLEKQSRSLIIAKNKLGRTGKINFNFYGNVQTFYEA